MKSLERLLKDEAATVEFGEDLALALKAGECVALSGDLGAGKSTFARAFIRAMADDETLEVPSPTFTLVQSYDLRIPVAHFDLYRLADASELDELGFDEALADGICLVEWPEKAEEALPADRITLTFSHEDDGRRIHLTAPDAAFERITRSLAIRKFLIDAAHPDARRRHLTAMLRSGPMNARHPGWCAGEDSHGCAETQAGTYPPGRQVLPAARPYRRGRRPIRRDLATPAQTRFRGTGDLRVRPRPGSAAHRKSWIRRHPRHRWPPRRGALHRRRAASRPAACQPAERDIAIAEGVVHSIPDFDRTAIRIETSLLVDWYLPWKRGRPASDDERREYFAVWDGLIDVLASAEKNLLLRDFHSPNILWRQDRAGFDRIGIIDFQDAMIGPTAYDVASLVQDARVTIEPDLAKRMMTAYISERRELGPFDEATFRRDWHLMAAQRNCKLAGIWVRLKERDGKPGYMKHMPRTFAYLEHALSHQVLTPLREWCIKAGILAPESANR